MAGNESKKRKTSSTEGGGKSNRPKLKSSSATSDDVHHNGLNEVAAMAGKAKKNNESKKRKTSSTEGGGAATSDVHYSLIKPCSNQDGKQKKIPEKPSGVYKSIPVYREKIQRDIQVWGRVKNRAERAKAERAKAKARMILKRKLGVLWEKMRCRNIAKEERSKLITDALQKMKGKMMENARSDFFSRLIQTCLKYGTPEERSGVYMELKPHLIEKLSYDKYAVHLVTKILDYASEEELNEFFSSLYEKKNIMEMLCNKVASFVIEHAYKVGNATQKLSMLLQFYFRPWKFSELDFSLIKEDDKLVDIYFKVMHSRWLGIDYFRQMLDLVVWTDTLYFSIIHKALIEFFSFADKDQAIYIMERLISQEFFRIIHTKDGSRVAMMCIKHASDEGRKKIIERLEEENIDIAAFSRYGNLVLVTIISIVDIKLVKKTIIKKLKEKEILENLIFDKFGRNVILQLLHPNCKWYLSPEDLNSFTLSIPSLISDQSESENENVYGKKRRKKLLIKSGLAKKLINACCEMAKDLLKSNYGKDIIYEVATGGADEILLPRFSEKLKSLYQIIAQLVSEPKPKSDDDPNEEHLLEQYHSSRTIRKLILNCPTFAKTLWEESLKGRCSAWAKGHSSKVISAFLLSSVSEAAKQELQPLIDTGLLQLQTYACCKALNQ